MFVLIILIYFLITQVVLKICVRIFLLNSLKEQKYRTDERFFKSYIQKVMVYRNSYLHIPLWPMQICLKKITPRYIFFLHWDWRVPHVIWQQHECVCFHMTDVPYGRGGSPLQNLILEGTMTILPFNLSIAENKKLPKIIQV